MALSTTINPDIIKIIKKLRNERRQKEISQEQLANLAGLHRNYVGKIERLENSPSMDSIIKIARALKIKLSKLFKDL
jgi:transcriptional regulator with XRE-family HTH domain